MNCRKILTSIFIHSHVLTLSNTGPLTAVGPLKEVPDNGTRKCPSSNGSDNKHSALRFTRGGS